MKLDDFNTFVGEGKDRVALNKQFAAQLEKIKKSLELPPPPKGYIYLYHATDQAHIPSIEKNGLSVSTSRVKGTDSKIMPFIWSMTSDGYGKDQGRPMVIFKMKTDDPRLSHMYSTRPNQVVEVTGDVSADEIVKIYPSVTLVGFAGMKSRLDAFIEDVEFFGRTKDITHPNKFIEAGDPDDADTVETMLKSKNPELIKLGKIGKKLL